MIKEALKDPKNEYFCLLSGECIPLFTYWETFKKITSTPKSRVNIDYEHAAWQEKGLYYADQWVILNRDAAKLMVELKDTERGRKWKQKLQKDMCLDDWCFCPDEIYPINWFVYNYGKPSSSNFKKNFKVGPSTYTFWKNDPHPIKFNRPQMDKMKREICKSGAIFGRKFNAPAAAGLAMTCSEFYKK